MATAKRVKQEDAVDVVRTPCVTQRFVVTETDGVEVRRIPYSPVTTTRISEKRTPQPDRIVLEMSEAEAEAVSKAVGLRVWTRAYDDIYPALKSALSYNTGTQTSPAKDAGCGPTKAQYKPLHWDND